MDVRDLFFWAAEANRKGLVRRTEAANAALLPWQEPKKISSYMNSLGAEMMELEHEGEAEKADRENERLIAEAQVKMDAKRARLKAARDAGEPVVRRRPMKSSKAKVIR
ncbi:MAG: hypothetical protein IMZ57_04230 [Acidobacteria bacterium]|nr:hypothetical protein [Acidobacteriota bacterium]